MKLRYVTLISILLFLLQTTLFQYFRIGGVIPNTSLIFIILMTVLYGKTEGLLSAVLLGSFQDIFLSKALCMNLLIYLAISACLILIDEKIFKNNYTAPIIIFVSTTVIYNLMYGMFLFFMNDQLNYTRSFLEIIPIEVVYNTIIGVFVYKKLFKRVFGYELR